jgi:ABC-type multidrug transport system ATPase subunit
MSKIVHLSREGMSVAATIHQPSSELWGLFDKLLLLVEGRTAYYGKANTVVEYFATLGYECPQYTNPADFLLGLVNSDFEGHADIDDLVQSTCAAVCFVLLLRAATSSLTSCC